VTATFYPHSADKTYAPPYPVDRLSTTLTSCSRGAGAPVRFCVSKATAATLFDIHQHFLVQESPLIRDSRGLARIMKKKAIELLNIDPEAFLALCQWIYDKASPPNPTEAANLQLLVELWVAAGKLGLHEKQNTLMRIGMALMQPKEFVCSFATVRWVYEHTAANSSLRPYIITIFCERGPPFTTPGTFTAVSATLGISCDAFQFTQVLSKVRASNPKGKEEYDLSS
jgi:hypothetical protein